MKIVHLTDYYQPQVGYQDPNLAQAHKALGHDVTVITSDRYFPFPNYQKTFQKVLGQRIRTPGVFEEEGITVHRLKPIIEHAPASFIVLKGITKLLKKIRPDLVISHGIIGLHPYITAKNKQKLNYKLIFDNHGAKFNTNLYDSLVKRTYLKFWKLFIRPQILKSADKIVAIGEGEQELAVEILEINKNKVEIIPLGADGDKFKPQAELRKQGRAELNLKDDELLLVHAGKLTPNKNVHLLLNSFGKLIKTNLKLKLLIIGNADAQYEQELKELELKYNLKKHLIWKDFVPNQDLPKYFNSADIGVWPGNPSNVIHEAVCTGLPVVIKDHPSSRFLVQRNWIYTKDALFDSDVPASLTDVLLNLIQNPDKLEAMRKDNAKFGQEVLDWKRIGQRFLETG